MSILNTTESNTTMSPSKLTAKLTKSLKKRLLSSLPWITKKNKTSTYEPLDLLPTDESDENALNEALEARLMEIIASSPAQQSCHVTLRATVPADPPADLFLVVSTRCQRAEPQVM